MCEHCTPFTTKDFSSQQDFGDFYETLEAACINETFIRVVNADETGNVHHKETYQCTFCETDWVLYVHKRAWNGSFLPTAEVTVYEEHQTDESNTTFETFKTFQGKSNKNCGCCLLLFLVLLGSIVYGLYSLVSFLFDLLF